MKKNFFFKNSENILIFMSWFVIDRFIVNLDQEKVILFLFLFFVYLFYYQYNLVIKDYFTSRQYIIYLFLINLLNRLKIYLSIVQNWYVYFVFIFKRLLYTLSIK